MPSPSAAGRARRVPGCARPRRRRPTQHEDMLLRRLVGPRGVLRRLFHPAGCCLARQQPLGAKQRLPGGVAPAVGPVGPLYGQRGRRGQSRRRPWRGGMPFLPAQRAQQEVAHGLGQSGRPLHVAAVRVVANVSAICLLRPSIGQVEGVKHQPACRLNHFCRRLVPRADTRADAVAEVHPARGDGDPDQCRAAAGGVVDGLRQVPHALQVQLQGCAVDVPVPGADYQQVGLRVLLSQLHWSAQLLRDGAQRIWQPHHLDHRVADLSAARGVLVREDLAPGDVATEHDGAHLVEELARNGVPRDGDRAEARRQARPPLVAAELAQPTAGGPPLPRLT
mmetsp:Transcript_32941/g.85421  ORF Transcript_32941/g.85421 Transcript_32941/m.85421 type:complete len:336 (-) Transcript_32941:1236-2243(-)